MIGICFTCSAYDACIPAGGKTLIKTDIQIHLPPGCYGRVAPRSGLTHKHFLDVGAGVIDEDYRGNVGVILFNFNTESFQVSTNVVGDRYLPGTCQLALNSVSRVHASLFKLMLCTYN